MILLTATTDNVQLVTSAAVTVDVVTTWLDHSSGASTATEGRTLAQISTATTQDISGSPGASTARNVRSINIRNRSTTSSVDVTVRFNANGTTYELHKTTLSPGDLLQYAHEHGFFELEAVSNKSYSDSNGAAQDQNASAADTYLTGSAVFVGGRLKVGSVYQLACRATKTAAGTAAPVWNLRVGTAGSIADTARVTWTAGAQTAAADAGLFELTVVVTNYSTSGVLRGLCMMEHTQTTTGFQTTAQAQILDATSAAFDLTATGLYMGVSVNPGTAGIWTFTTVAATVSGMVG